VGQAWSPAALGRDGTGEAPVLHFLAQGRWTKLNPRPIRPTGSSGPLEAALGTRYELIDSSAVPGKRYWYRLESGDVRGGRELHPVSAATAASRTE